MAMPQVMIGTLTLIRMTITISSKTASHTPVARLQKGTEGWAPIFAFALPVIASTSGQKHLTGNETFGKSNLHDFSVQGGGDPAGGGGGGAPASRQRHDRLFHQTGQIGNIGPRHSILPTGHAHTEGLHGLGQVLAD